MYYYQFHIGDFRSGCHNMTRQERWLYRDLLDVYYDSEKPLPDNLDEICKMIGARGEAEREMVSEILILKFEQTESGWQNKRCEQEIATFHGKKVIASFAGKVSAQKRAEAKEALKNTTTVKRSSNKRSTTVEQTLNGGSTESNGSSTNQEPITNNHKPDDKSTVEPVGPTEQVFSHWQKVMEKPRAQLDMKRSRAITGRLKDGYSAEQLCKAIDGCRRDPFSMGQNDRNTPFNDIELICRDGSRVDKFITIAERGGAFIGHNMQVNHLDHSSSRKAMEESMRKHGISEIPEGEIEL